MKNMRDAMSERVAFERRVRAVLGRPRAIHNLINRINKEQDYALGFYRELCRKGFLDRQLSIFFYNLIIYIEDLYFPAYSKQNTNRYKKF